MKVKIFLLIMVISLFSTSYVLAQEAEMNMEDSDTMESMAAVEVGNTLCPVSGEEVNKMGNPVQYEYNGKIYNFCCSDCVEEFKKAPEKYIKKMNDKTMMPDKE